LILSDEKPSAEEGGYICLANYGNKLKELKVQRSILAFSIVFPYPVFLVTELMRNAL
jgi:hypothetical protein